MLLFAWVVVGVAAVYLLLGVGFALFFVVRGASRIDPAAAEGTFGFRLLIFPGSVALWPLLMRRQLPGSLPPEESNAHRADARRGVDE